MAPAQVLSDGIEERLSSALNAASEVEDRRDFSESFLLLRRSQQADFLERFENLSIDDRALALAIHTSGLPDAEDDRSRARLVRGAIMIPDGLDGSCFNRRRNAP